MKVAEFTVRVTAEQSLRWKRAAEADGHRAAGTWLAEAADAYLKARARAGRPLPLAWHRGRFRVVLTDGQTVEVRGMASPPFGLFQGSAHGPDRNMVRTLVHIPSGRIVATLRTSRQCKALASELAPVWVRDPETVVGVVERHQRESV